MTDRTILTLSNPTVRQRAIEEIKAAEDGSRVILQGPKRTLPQNARLWSALKDLSRSLPYHGQKLSAEDYKTLLMDALWRETRMLPNMTDDGFVQMRRATSELSVRECEQLISLAYEFGYRHGVVFSVDARDGILPSRSEAI
jgi:hypothetical protein